MLDRRTVAIAALGADGARLRAIPGRLDLERARREALA